MEKTQKIEICQFYDLFSMLSHLAHQTYEYLTLSISANVNTNFQFQFRGVDRRCR